MPRRRPTGQSFGLAFRIEGGCHIAHYPSMVINLIRALKKEEKKAAALESRIAKELGKEFLQLPTFYGFDSVQQFVDAVVKAHAGTPKGKAGGTAASKKRKRATITDAVRVKVGKMIKAGASGSKIAKAVGISLPSVYNIKAALKMLEAPKKAAAKRTPEKRKAASKKAKKRVTPKKAAAPEVKAIQAAAETAPAPAA
jgi:hypothetical protein